LTANQGKSGQTPRRFINKHQLMRFVIGFGTD